MFEIKRKHLPAIAIICMLIITHMLALTVVQTYPQEYRAFGDDVDDPTNPLIYIGVILLFTAGMLLVFKYGKENYLQYAILGVVGLTLFYVFNPVLFRVMYPFIESVRFYFSFFVSIILGIGLTYLLYKKPEWYVVNSIGIIMGAGIAGIFGMSFGILPVFILLIALGVYDFISVYKTKHMVSLASGVMKMKVPVMMVVPQKANYSFAEKEGIEQELDEDKEREAMFIGLGDLIIPGILPVAATIHLPSMWIGGQYAPLLVAVGSIIGASVGMIALTRFVLKGKPHAGLPLLNSGAILGYLLSYFVIYQDLTFGFVLPW
ncbi:MAG: presenilin family intramembrane aspartyl protease PSH [Candidatus Thermoplasmatota archaeon]